MLYFRYLKKMISQNVWLPIILIIALTCAFSVIARPQWTVAQANQWQAQQGWLIGCNFIPSTADNTLEMWQQATFDPITIDRELGYAHSLGFNIIRVFLHYLVWQQSPSNFKQRLDQFLQIADTHQIKTMFVFFDDVWGPKSYLGPQQAPIPGVHNSRWVQVPGENEYNNSALFPIFEAYITDIITTFQNDTRVVIWDIYNEPGNSQHNLTTLPLLKKVFEWARAANPSQPITSGIWKFDPDFNLLNAYQLSNSDILSFHSYAEVNVTQGIIQAMKIYGRPIVCSEYMARPLNSTFLTHVPMFYQQGVSCINWGLVSGKTQTIYPWNSPENAPIPKVWFHDILYANGTPFSTIELQFLQNFTTHTAHKIDFNIS